MGSLTHAENLFWRGLRAIERTLLVAAFVALSWYGWRSYEIYTQQTKATAEIDRALESADTSSGREVVPSSPPPIGGLIGRLTIPRLNLSAPVKAGDDETVLDFSVAYLRDTPLPWASGNSAFAAHRDRLFRPLQDIREGDDIELSTTHGNLHYRVLRTLIVDPQDVWVLDPIPKVSLTLITCYPFYFVGRAPHRFIVQAEKL
jgi:sortase A